MPFLPRLLASTLALASMCAASSVCAEEPPPIGRGEIQRDLLSYYGGEEASAYLIGGLGVASVAAGAVLVTRPNDFSRGLGWPLVSLGALEVLGGIYYVVQVRSEIHRYGTQLATDPTGFREVEASHIGGTRRRFVYYLLGEAGLTAAGIAFAAYGFAASRPTFEGIGIGGVAVGAPFLVMDSFNNARAGRYEDEVLRFVPSLAVAPAPGGAYLELRGLL